MRPQGGLIRQQWYFIRPLRALQARAAAGTAMKYMKATGTPKDAMKAMKTTKKNEGKAVKHMKTMKKPMRHKEKCHHCQDKGVWRHKLCYTCYRDYPTERVTRG